MYLPGLALMMEAVQVSGFGIEGVPAGSGFVARSGCVSRPISGPRETPPRGAHNLFDSSIAVRSVVAGWCWCLGVGVEGLGVGGWGLGGWGVGMLEDVGA